MFFNFGKKVELIEPESVLWMYDVFDWALASFDPQVFFNETILVTPTNAHFPGQAANEEELANLIFNKVKEYAGMKHWPCRLVDQRTLTEVKTPTIMLEGALRGSKGVVLPHVDEEHKLTIAYHPVMLKEPQMIVATYAYTLAHYLGLMAPRTPPGGEENRSHVDELLAVFLGFGVMMANTAFTQTIKSCGSCAKPTLERTNYLSQYHITYALAVFCALKEVKQKEVLGYLKSTLHPFFKKALKEVNANLEGLERLRAVSTPSPGQLVESAG